MVSGLMSGRDMLCTMTSSSMVLHTIKTMNPLRSMSSDSDLVSGSAGDPAMTTTSSLPPLRARFARRVFRPSLLLLYVL